MYPKNYIRNYPPIPQTGDRFGGFAVPFVLGGITGGLLAPAFYQNQRPYYYQPYPYPPVVSNQYYPIYYR